VDWLSILKTKPWGRVEVVQDENEDTSLRDEVFQVSEVVKPYRVAPSIELEENSNFLVFNDSLVDVYAEELNFVAVQTFELLMSNRCCLDIELLLSNC
jgi:hypothetical protein